MDRLEEVPQQRSTQSAFDVYKDACIQGENKHFEESYTSTPHICKWIIRLRENTEEHFPPRLAFATNLRHCTKQSDKYAE